MIVYRFSALAAVLVAVGLAMGQPPAKKDLPAPKESAKPAPGSLEDTLNKALQNSADIKAAEAKVREAEAQLNQVRQQVLTRATAIHSDLNLAKRMLSVAEQSLGMQEQLVKKGQAPVEGLLNAQILVEKHRGEVEKLQSELKSLRGEFAVHAGSGVRGIAFSPDGTLIGAASVDGRVRFWDATTGLAWANLADALDVQSQVLKASAVQPTMVDRVKKLLDREIDLNLREVQVGVALRTVLDVNKADVPLRDMLGTHSAAGSVTMTGKLTVGAWIQAIEDTDPAIRVVVRDYGLLLTTRERMPEGAMRVQDVWKGRYTELKKAEPKAPEKK